MKYILTTTIILISIVSYGQDNIKKVTKKDNKITEIYYVLKSNDTVRQGKYVKKFDGKVTCTGNFSNNKRSGIWNIYDEQNVIVLSYNFDNDSIISSIDKSNNYNHSPIKLFSESEMFSFFSDNVKYPKGAFENNFSGIVVIAIKIDTLGNPIDYYVFKSVQESIDAEALRVVRLFASNMKWIAGTKDGQKVESTDSIPIRFTLE